MLATPTPSSALLNNAGNHYLICSQPDKAEALFLRLTRIQPQHANANLQLARVANQRREGAKALEYLAHIQEDSVPLRLLRAEALEYAGRHEEAGRILQELERQSSDPRVLFATGITAARIGFFDNAESAFNRVLAVQPNNFDVLFNLGKAAARAKHYDRAQRALEVALKLKPADPDVLLELGLAYAAGNESSKAVFVLAQARQHALKRPDILLALARAAEDAGYFGDSIVAFDEYLALRPDDDTARRDRGRVCGLTRTRRQEGLKELKRYVEKHPTDPVGHYDLAQLTWTDQPDAALEQLSNSLRRDPQFAAAYFARGWLLYRLGRIIDAVPDLEAAVGFQPRNTKALNQLGLAYLALSQASKAEQMFRRALESVPQDPDAQLHLGRALMMQDKTDEAERHLEQFRKVRPQRDRGPLSEPVMLELATLPHAELAMRQIARLREEASSHPGDSELQLHLAGLLLVEGEIDAALAAYHELLIRNPDAKICYDAGAALVRAGHYDLAQQFLQRGRDVPGATLEYAIAVFFAQGPEKASEAMKEVPKSERNGDYFLMSALIAEASGRTAESHEYVREGLRQSPERADVAKQVASFLLKQKRSDDALRVIAAAARLNSGNPDLILMQAVILTATDRMPEAQKIIRNIELRWPEWARAYVADGLVLARLGNTGEAVRKLQVAAALSPDDEGLRCVQARIAGPQNMVEHKCACGNDVFGLLPALCR